MITLKSSKHGILVVANNLQMRRALLRALSDQGYQNLAARNYADVMPLTESPPIQLCVMELEGEHLEAAIEAVHLLRLEASVSKFILIADSVGEAESLLDMGIEGVRILSRPFSMLEFIAAVDQTSS